MNIDKKIVDDLVANDVSFVTTVPCKQLAGVIEEVEARDEIFHIPSNKEDEGMGLCAGAFMGGKRPAIIMQNTAIGVTINTLARIRQYPEIHIHVQQTCGDPDRRQLLGRLRRPMIRSEILKEIAPILNPHLVVCNIGLPSQELHMIDDNERNFYMLGTMGLSSSIGFGLALAQDKPVISIDGDGSVLTNLGTLPTIANNATGNYTLLIIDNVKA